MKERFFFKDILQFYNEDALEALSKIDNERIGLVITSPPYNLGKEYEKKTTLKEYLHWQKKIIRECARILKPSGSICWQIGNYVEKGEVFPLDIYFYKIFKALGLQLRNRIVWHFGHGLHCSKRFSGRYETILWFTKTDEYVFNLDPIRVPSKYPNKRYFKGSKKGQLSCNPLGKNPSDVWDIPNVKANHVEKTCHPCQFPVELVERLVLSMTDEGDIVLDPFMGVGSSAVAALMHKRKFIGCEISKEYVSIAAERIDKAQKGGIKIRPKERPIFDPRDRVEYIPPKQLKLKIPLE